MTITPYDNFELLGVSVVREVVQTSKLTIETAPSIIGETLGVYEYTTTYALKGGTKQSIKVEWLWKTFT